MLWGIFETNTLIFGAKVFIIAALAYIILLAIRFVNVIDAHIESKSAASNLALAKFHSTVKVNYDAGKLLDAFIEDEFNRFILINPISDIYISQEAESEMIRKLTDSVSERISYIFLSQLCLYYNSDNMADIIAEKIYLTVVNYVVEFNSNKSDTQ